MKIKFCLLFSMTVLFCLNVCNLADTADKQNNQQQQSLKATPQGAKQTKAERLTDTAKFLAGIQVDKNSPLAESQKSNSWQKQREFFDNNWSKLETEQLKKVRQWSQQELKHVHNSSAFVFYPFSGPDFLYAYSFFPRGKEYILIGLEPAGKVLDLTTGSQSDRNQKLDEVRSSLYSILRFSFFRTNDMKVDLQKQGVLPILYVFLARTNNRIIDVQNIGIDKKGKIQMFKKGMIPGVKIIFVPQAQSQPRTLYYLSADLSNDGLKKRPELSKYITGINKNITYLKAASYLMHNDSFYDIKRTILDNSKFVFQDDSGIPLKAFDESKWNLRFYGVYNKPINLFSNSYQEKLRKVYANTKNIKPLNFGIGYKFAANDSNLMLAESKKITAPKKP